SDETLFDLARERALALMSEGVTTIEIKSGYGLAAEHEARCLRVARRLGRELSLDVRTTCLSAHALPPEFAGRADDYIDAVCAWLPALHAEGLVDAVDGFCDRIGFTAEQTRRVFDAARRLGLPVKLHAEQLSDQHSAVLAAEYGALSCDHLEYVGADGVAAMAAAGTVAVLLPGAFYFLRETRLPPVAALRARRRRRRRAMSEPAFTLERGTAPLLLSLPHVGTAIADDVASALVPRALGLEDTDWHLAEVYGFARELGASVLVPRFSRYVIDLNRPPENVPMYPGANNTELVPTRFFSGDPLYRDGRLPDERELERRV